MKELYERVLITGANGMLGTKLIERLKLRPDIEIFAIGRGPNRNPDKLGYLYESIDIRNFTLLERFFKHYRPTVVIHAAAMTNVDECERKPKECWKINVEGTENVAKLCKTFNAYMIFLSTDFVFDGKDSPYDEEAEPNPLQVYGSSKREAELKINALQFPHVVLRAPLLYGVVPNASRTNAVLWVKSNLEQKKPIRVVTDQVRMPTLVEDLAEACFFALNKKALGTYHIAGKDLMSIYELALKVAKFWNLDTSLITPVRSKELNLLSERPPEVGFILEKAIKELGYRPRPFIEGLEIIKQQLSILEPK